MEQTREPEKRRCINRVGDSTKIATGAVALTTLTMKKGGTTPILVKWHGYNYPLVSIQKTSKNYGRSPFLMGKSTISTGPCSIAMLVIARGYITTSQKVEKSCVKQ